VASVFIRTEGQGRQVKRSGGCNLYQITQLNFIRKNILKKNKKNLDYETKKSYKHCFHANLLAGASK
jgi:hypothetical protein